MNSHMPAAHARFQVEYKYLFFSTLFQLGASCTQKHVVTKSFYENITHMESQSTVVGWTSTSGHTVQK